jgi:hypothetical protein
MWENTYEVDPYKYICCELHPHHSTISDFRKRFLPEIEYVFDQILDFLADLGLLESGACYVDGTKMEANASKHHAYSYKRAVELKTKFEKEIKELMEKSQQDDSLESPKVNVIDEIKLREKWLCVLNTAIYAIEQREKDRYDNELKVFNDKMEERKNKENETGQKSRGKAPSPPKKGPSPKAQYNCTDPDSRIMHKSGKAFIQGYNAQAGVEPTNMFVIFANVTQNPNDKNEIAPAIEEFRKLRDSNINIAKTIADNGYFSANNIKLCEKNNIEPFFATGRIPHHTSINDLLNAKTKEIPADASPIEKMKCKLQTEEGKKIYALRKSVVEPAFGIIKSALGIRRFRLRGFKNVCGEWKLICLSYNLKKLHSVFKAL